MSEGELRFANQLEIIRSEEKDRFLISQLVEPLEEFYSKSFGLNRFDFVRTVIKSVSELIYYSTTSLSNRQTIGEEYVCLIQYDPKTRRVPTLLRRVLMVFLRVFEEILLKKFVEKCFTGSTLNKETIDLLKENVVKYVRRIHRMFFFFNGSFYDLSKTLTNVRYLIYTKSNSENDEIRRKISRTMKIVSVCLLIESFLQFYNDLKQIRRSVRRNQEEKENSNDEQNSVRCPLCFDSTGERTSLLVTCGHVFCWDCIHQWTAEHQTCPVCKVETSQSRIVLLINF